jgi:hypothetical protein
MGEMMEHSQGVDKSLGVILPFSPGMGKDWQVQVDERVP